MTREIRQLARDGIAAVIERRALLVLYVLATGWFMVQHATGLSWDFTAYLLNAEYLVGQGMYFEPFRPPLTPFLLAILTAVVGSTLAPYIYIAGVTAVFFVAADQFGRTLGFTPVVTIALFLTPFVLTHGLFHGTELLSTAFLLLFLTELISPSGHGGVAGGFLGLAVLTRYPYILFLPLLLANRSVRRIIANIAATGVILLPWLAVNQYWYGNMLTGIADSYAQNVLYRHYTVQPVDWGHILQAASLLTPLIAIGAGRLAVQAVNRWKKQGSIRHWLAAHRIGVILVLFAGIAASMYVRVPFKEARYLFPIVIPFVSAAYVGLEQVTAWIGTLDRRVSPQWIAVGLVLLSLTVTVAGYDFGERTRTTAAYDRAVDAATAVDGGNCALSSNVWVHLNRAGRLAEPAPRPALLDDYVADGYTIVLWKRTGKPGGERSWNTTGLPIRHETPQYMVISNRDRCTPAEPYTERYVEQLDWMLRMLDEEGIVTEPCRILFSQEPAQDACIAVHELLPGPGGAQF